MPSKSMLPPSNLTRFGQWVEEHRSLCGITIEALCGQLGLYYDNYRRITNGVHTSIHLPTVIKMAKIFSTSPMEPLFILYNQQASGETLTDTEKEMYCRMLSFFDLLYRLDDRTAEAVFLLMSGMLEKGGGRQLDESQEKFIERLRMYPAGDSGRSKTEERLKKAI
jgi:hypothetical protein